ncbi:hypothetical protein BU25DRAFT_449780 [Macroventuria anomochaeta]|uniref:Uncharacterized protein n=1 Tax=Macroventuria anomochaeta TaxID=301207 RepID=A0ACB6RX28_9PLEO|nr:uncharacterized protein BU25DRAFT_449780 [Macroventuria anomochaeta]KAF2625688.1 hypothetical protein BU25DRAFT_449780 [Macroventuria anomochaeta]
MEFVENFTKVAARRQPTFNTPYIRTSDTNNDTKFRYHTGRITNEHTNGTLWQALSGTLSATGCSAFPLVVESRVDCQGRLCAAQAMRRLTREPDKINGNYESASTWFGTICASMPGADIGMLQDNSTSSELVDQLLMGPDLSTFQWDRMPGGERWIWFAVGTIAISLFLFAAAVASLVLGIFTKAPDTLGFASTSARDNLYAKLASSCVSENRMCQIAVILFRSRFEGGQGIRTTDKPDDEGTHRSISSLDFVHLIPAACEWIKIAGHDLVLLLNVYWNDFPSRIGAGGSVFAESKFGKRAATGFTPWRWMYWLKSLYEIQDEAKEAPL